jgi:exonuclease III
MCAGIHPNPGPPNTTSPPKTFLQFNCNGIQSSKAVLQDFLLNNQVKVAALRETKLNSKSKQPSFQDYTLVHKDRPAGRGGGLAFLIHHFVHYTDLDVTPLISPGDQVIKLQGISVFINNAYIKVFNVYIPPVSANTRYFPNISKILDISDDALVLGDLNAHNEA